MKRTILPILFCIAQALVPHLTAQDWSGLDSLMAEFFASMEREDIDTKNAEADFLIGSCRDSLTRQHVALAIFDHYRDSRVMGEESVAIHVYDDWFASGKTSFQGELDKMDAEVFTKFNRNSQIGMDAPKVSLFKPDGRKLVMPQEGLTSVIFFYDTHCSKCQLELKLLPTVLKDIDFDINLYLVNSTAECSRKEWRSVMNSIKIRNRHVHVFHLWDPDMESGYEFEYGVIATPRVYMVEPGGMIIGRRLEMDNLPQMFTIASAMQEVYTETK